MRPVAAGLSWLRRWPLSIGVAYGVVGLLIVVGAAPVWCLAVLLTLPTAVRAVHAPIGSPAGSPTGSPAGSPADLEEDPPDAGHAISSEAAREWLLAFTSQLIVGYVIASIAR
jgi:hypothetical protein